MSKLLMYLFIFFFLLFNDFHEPPVIVWSDSYVLSWKDFKGEPNAGTNAVAITASGISFEYSIKQNAFGVRDFKTSVKACFFPNSSWYKPVLVNDYVLAHEQLHYNITELYARKFRKEIAALKPSRSLKKELTELQKRINNQLTNRQNDYDSETNHSRNPEAQKHWELMISMELKALEDFKI